MTIGGKPLQDHVEAVNHRNAFQYIQEIAKSETDFSASVLLDIHDFILKNIELLHSATSRRPESV